MIENACKVYVACLGSVLRVMARKRRTGARERTPRIKNSREQIHHQVNDRPAELSVIPSRFTSRRYSSTSVSLSVCLSSKGVAGETDGLTVRQSVVFPRVYVRASSRILFFSFFFYLVRRCTIKRPHGRRSGFLKAFNCRPGTRSNINYQHFTEPLVAEREFLSSTSSSDRAD